MVCNEQRHPVGAATQQDLQKRIGLRNERRIPIRMGEVHPRRVNKLCPTCSRRSTLRGYSENRGQTTGKIRATTKQWTSAIRHVAKGTEPLSEILMAFRQGRHAATLSCGQDCA